MYIRNRQDLGGSVDEHRNVLLIRQLRDRSRAERPLIGFGAREDVDHCSSRTKGGFELLTGTHLDDVHADRADGCVVHVARVLWNDDFVLRKPGQIGHPHVKIGVSARHARGGRMRQGGGASRRHHSPFRFRQLRQTCANRRHELVQVHMVLRGGVDRRPHLRQHTRAADDGERAASVDERPHADGLIDGLADAKSVGSRRSSRRQRGRGRASTEESRQRQQSRSPKQLAAAQGFSAAFPLGLE